MSKTQETELKHKQFWNRMERNSTVVARMPTWMKGSPINQRVQTPSKVVDQTKIVKSAPTPNR
jgi:hypothetical protein